ncbi:hypothetical protein T459_11491 [Capsicum annuum]|uniref:Uncharacterized protein n=1 Tax=Capsicum annuum TaxID=4072 RepID=A0A2G2ZM16_CAPAN|nr:hypothetical protein T459_11491 [Capsicum annuum]
MTCLRNFQPDLKVQFNHETWSQRAKRSISVSKAISMVLASGVFLVAVTILCQRYLPHLPINKYPVNSSDIISIRHQSMESSESSYTKNFDSVHGIRAIQFYADFED